MLVVVAIIATVGAISAMVVPGVIALAKADSGAGQLQSALRVAREQAISQRRNIRVEFVDPNQIVVSRVEEPSHDLTQISSTLLEGGLEYRLFAGVADTDDAFGNGTAVSFGDAESVQFTSEGTLVDEDGDIVNGSVFVGVPNQPATARAVTIFGATALIREWRWQGSAWVN